MASTSDALLGLLSPAWQAVVAGCLLLVTVVGVVRLAERGPARMTNAVFVTGFLILAVTALGALAVSCSDAPRGAAPSPADPSAPAHRTNLG